MKQHVTIAGFGKGLQTKAAEDYGAPDAFRVFQNVRSKNGLAKRRAGQAWMATASSIARARNFDGTNDVVTIPKDTRIWALPLRFTLRFLLAGDDTPAGDEFILGWSSTGNKPLTIKRDSNRKVVVDFWDSAGTQTTLTSATATTNAEATPCALVRDTSSLTLYIGNTADATGSVSATLAGRTPADNLTIGAHNGANFFDGTLDYLDLQSGVVASDNASGFLRLLDPRAEPVMACYWFDGISNNLLTDHSRYENTGLVSGPSDTAALCVAHAPVQALVPYLDKEGGKRVVVMAGGSIYNTGVN